MVRLSGAEGVILSTTPEDNFMIDPAALEAAITPNTRLLILCTPSNPTGSVYTLERMQAIAQIVARHPKLLVCAPGSRRIQSYHGHAGAVCLRGERRETCIPNQNEMPSLHTLAQVLG
jgi:hypothetical protein